jgi:flagellar basal body-associated protein FliL
MADESEEGGGGGGGGGGDGGSVLKKYGPLAAIVLLAQVVLAWVVISFVFKDNVPEEEQEDLIPEQSVELLSGQVEEKSRLPYYYSSEAMGAITANPAGTNSERFVVLTVQLGLEAYNRDESPPDDDITKGLSENTAVTDKIALYDQRIVSVISKTVRLKTIDELDGEFIHEIEDEVRKRLNKEIFERLFVVTEEEKTEVIVSEVDISNIIIQ